MIKGDPQLSGEVRRACFTFFAPVLSAKRVAGGRIKSTFYKNKFCARCNGVQLGDLYCSSGHLPKVHWSKVAGYKFSLDPFSGSGGGRCHSDLELFDQYARECRRVFLDVPAPREVGGSGTKIYLNSLILTSVIFIEIITQYMWLFWTTSRVAFDWVTWHPFVSNSFGFTDIFRFLINLLSKNIT